MKNRKCILILAVLAAFLLTGCSSDFFEPVFTNHRFECVGSLDDIDIPMDRDDYVYQIRDTETGVNYICIAGHYRASICPMYDADGQVVVTN